MKYNKVWVRFSPAQTKSGDKLIAVTGDSAAIATSILSVFFADNGHYKPQSIGITSSKPEDVWKTGGLHIGILLDGTVERALRYHITVTTAIVTVRGVQALAKPTPADILAVVQKALYVAEIALACEDRLFEAKIIEASDVDA